jgi:hypothetical protein
MKIGTAISNVATPVARWFNMPCVDPATNQLRPDSTCAKVRDDLDAGQWRSALYDFIWRKGATETGERTNTMQQEAQEWIIVHQLGIIANSYLEAIQNMDKAETISVSCQVRQQMPQGGMGMGGMRPMRQVSPGVFEELKPPQQETKSEKK